MPSNIYCKDYKQVIWCESSDKILVAMTIVKLLSIIYFLNLLYISDSKEQNNFFVANFKEVVFTCVTNSSYALSWIDEDNKEAIQRVSAFIPKSQENDFDCDIDNDHYTKQHYIKDPWRLENSLDNSNSELIFDRRWEDMKIYLTKFTKGHYQPLNFVTAVSNLKYNFEIPISIRTEKEANIFLCDDEKPYQSNCYWFSLRDNYGKNTLRKCENGTIQAFTNSKLQSSCQSILGETDKLFSYNYLSKKMWFHFKLTKKENRLSLTLFDKNVYNNIISFSEEKQVININNLIISSNTVNGLWKIHQFYYIYTNKESDKINLGPGIYVTNGSVCISMFIIMCSHCRLKLTLTKQNDQNFMIFEKMYWLEQAKWTEIKLIVDNILSEKVTLLVSTIGKNQDDRFWGIDKIRLCQKKEFRKIDISKKATCQLISDSNSNNLVSFQEQVDNPVENCPESSIGSFCVPCKWIYRNCENVQFCEKYLNGIKCSCSSGSQGLKTCGLKCFSGYYGHNCQKKCEKCFGRRCDRYYGTCSRCVEDYSGSKCNIPPSMIFRHPPELTQISFTDISVTIKNFEVQNAMKNDSPDYFSIQYKESNDVTQKWNSLGKMYKFNEINNIEINSLEPGTEYLIRSVITSTSGVVYLNDNIPFSKFKTKCLEIGDQNVVINQTDTSVKIWLNESIGPICKTDTYPKIFISDRTKPIFFENNEAIIEGLTPFTNYVLFIEGGSVQFETSFSTSEAAPSPIQNFNFVSVTPTSIKLEWKEPLVKNGIIQHYNVKYQHLNSSRDHSKLETLNIAEPMNRQVKETYLTVENLIPGSTYFFTVVAVNSKCHGKPFIKMITIPFSENYQIEEISSTSTTTTLKSFTTKASEIKCTALETVQFTNQTSVLSVYSKNENSLSIRWKSFSPSKILINYYYCDDEDIKKDENYKSSEISTCKLWPEFYCIKLINLKINHNYVIKVFKNETLQEIGRIQANTFIEPSEAPYDLIIKWTLKNDLKLEWKHPNITNGEIIYFNVSITPQISNMVSVEKIFIVSKNEYRLSYNYTIQDVNVIPSTPYKISVNAFNGYSGKEVFKTDSSPPRIPLLDRNPEIFITDENVIASFSPAYAKISKNDKFSVYLLVSSVSEQSERTKELGKKCGMNLEEFENAYECKLKNFGKSNSIITSFNNQMEQCSVYEKKNSSFNPADYNITMLLSNSFNDKTRCRLYSVSLYTVLPPKAKLSDLLLYLLIVVFLIVLVIGILFKCYKIVKFRMEHLYQEPDFTIQNNSKNILQEKKTCSHRYDYAENVFHMPIKKTEFEKYVKKSFHNGNLEHQHSLLLSDPLRVTYEEPKHDCYFDQIDFISNGIKISRSYMVTKAPTLATIRNFWKCIWKEDIKNIVNLSRHSQNSKKQNENFWTSIQNEIIHYRKLTVQNTFQKTYPDYEYKEFLVVYKNKTKKVNMLHFTEWRDNEIPLYSENLVPFFEEMIKIPLTPDSPILVFCKNGLEGAGFAILCDMCLRIIENEETVDILWNLYQLCNVKTNLVKNVDHYKLTHLVILEFLSTRNTSISCYNMTGYVPELIRNDEIYQQMCYLDDTCWIDQAVNSIKNTDDFLVVAAKNRCQTVIPTVQGRVLLSPHPPDDIESSYINAVKVDGFRFPEQFIVTQQPMPSTLGDFWRLVIENDVSTVVSLNEIYTLDKSCCNFWPTEEKPEMHLLDGMLRIKYEDNWMTKIYNLITVQLHFVKDKEYKTVNIVSMKNWPAKVIYPRSIEIFLMFWEEAASFIKKSDRTVITCYDGATASGLYVALSYILCQIQLEDICDVCTAVRRIRRNRKEFIQDEVQLCFLYEAALLYYVKKSYNAECNYEIPRTLSRVVMDVKENNHLKKEFPTNERKD